MRPAFKEGRFGTMAQTVSAHFALQEAREFSDGAAPLPAPPPSTADASLKALLALLQTNPGLLNQLVAPA